MTILGASVIAVCTVFLSMYLKKQQKEIAALICIAGSVTIFAGAVRQAEEMAQKILDMPLSDNVSDLAQTLIKALGISAISQIGADICRESGETIIASHVELFAKIEITLLSLPLAARLIELAGELLS